MPSTFQTHELSNGLTIIAETDPEALTASAGFFVGVGARDEPSELMGVSHFLEHMMFKGTEDIGAAELNQRYDAMGARNNAYTSHELTCFYASTIAAHARDSIDLTARMMRPALRTEDFETEKGVILEEIAMYNDNPFWVLYEQTCERHYGNSPLGHRVLGTEATIKSLTRDQMAGYFEARYAADTTTVALAGNVDFDAACRQVESLCGSWPRSATPRDRQAPTRSDRRLEIDDGRFGRGYLLALIGAPPAQSDDRYAAAIAAQILGGIDNSRLHWALVEPGIAEEAQADYQPHDGSGELLMFASGDPARLDEVERIMIGEAESLAESLTADDLDKVRSRYATSFTVGSERPADRMQRIGRRWAALGSYRSLEEELAQIEAVDADAVRRVLERYPMSPRTIGTLRPPASA
ncbi:MAG: pitrilysin family protein [Planctomycetota bacterium]